MKKIKGFRLGRRLVRLWRWMRRPRGAKRAAYLRLATTPPPSPPRRHSGHGTERTEVPAMLAQLARCFTRRLRHAPRASSGGDDGGSHSRLLGDENQGKQQQQQRGVARAEPPPKGHLVVYVGRKGVDPLYRVPVPVVYFNHPLFGELLRRTEREFGFHQPGGITIPCPLSDFESVRTRVAADAGVSCRHRGQPAGH